MTRGAALLAAAVVAGACGAPAPSIERVAEGYVRATLKLAQHDPTLVDAWRGPAAWRPGPREPVAALLEDIDALRRMAAAVSADVSPATDRARITYLEHQLRALRFAAERQLGRATTIDEQAREEFGIELPALDRAHMQRIRDRLERALPGAGSLDQRVTALRTATIVPRDRRALVMQRALAACRTATNAVMTLPAGESVRVLWRPDLAWDAHAGYAGDGRTDVEINDGAPLDISRALRLACHEGYPGHHVQYLVIDGFRRTHYWPELQLEPGFGRHLLLAEGAAEAGADLALPPDARRALYRAGLYPAAGLATATVDTLVTVEDLLIELLPIVTSVARQYLDGGITQERAIEQLRQDALVTNPAATLAFIERRRARALVYGEGRRVVYQLMKTRDLAGLRDAFQAPAALQ